MALPGLFCWTKFGAEAGETPDSICLRKEDERRRNGGVFLWGIGSGIGPSLQRLLEIEPHPHVCFTPMLAPPKNRDVRPERVVRWTKARGFDGSSFEIPAHSVVTSRGKSSSSKHYALVCRSADPLAPGHNIDCFSAMNVVNLLSGRPVGASQVTAIVRTVDRDELGPYRVAFKATLVPPYFVELGGSVSFEQGDPSAILVA